MGVQRCKCKFQDSSGAPVSSSEFFAQHTDIRLTPDQQDSSLGNLELLIYTFLRQTYKSDDFTYIPPHCQGFVFPGQGFGELYFLPLSKVNIGFFFRKVSKIEIIFYDIRVVNAVA